MGVPFLRMQPLKITKGSPQREVKHIPNIDSLAVRIKACYYKSRESGEFSVDLSPRDDTKYARFVIVLNFHLTNDRNLYLCDITD